MIRPTSSDADSTCRIGRKKADEDQLQSTVQNILKKLRRPTNKNCPMVDRRLGYVLGKRSQTETGPINCEQSDTSLTQ
ncbi:hypothetical protein DPX16_15674 [Anabarilius grahami]|uniref:Uncharacterized protein n=1 Tax=Anabarilius grahami TaxID=495550 RepID=A0A3N0YUH9_ANAGA|nr:hypothetical protein DPX16_15674 [Anabarilius grahami]